LLKGSASTADITALSCFGQQCLKIEVPESDAGNDRQSLPVEVKPEDRRLSSRRPRAPPMGPLAQAAFVYEDDRPALFLSFFLIAGQRWCFQW
jgi:hypothetical protein